MVNSVDNVADYIIAKTTEGGASLNLLKLQKLVYYAQAWHLAFFDAPLFNGSFQAWVHGPVNRYLYDRFRETKSLYSDVTGSDVRTSFDPEKSLSAPERAHIDSVLEVYAKFSGSQLEEMTHNEEPWRVARADTRPSERSENLLDEALMGTFYKARLGK